MGRWFNIDPQPESQPQPSNRPKTYKPSPVRAVKRQQQSKLSAYQALDTLLDTPEPGVPIANPIPDAPPFPPPGMTFEPNGRGLVPFKGDKEYEQYLTELAPIEELRTALAMAGGEKALNFLSDIIHYSKPSKSKPPTLAILAKRNGLSLDQITEIWRNYSNVRGMTKIFSAAPTIADNTLRAASPTTIICSHCGGEGQVDKRPPRLGAECPTCFGAKRITKLITTALGNEQSVDLDCPTCATPTLVPCKQCSGEGTLSKPGDHNHAKMLFETMGWIKSKSPSVNINLNSASRTMDTILDELDAETPTIDALYTTEP